MDVTNLIGDKINGSIHIDESGVKKDGKDSVGVKRQYLGRLGKVDNCQMGVFLGYANGNRRTLIDERLYLPEDWANDPIRRKKCGVPDDIVFKTKAQLGLEMLLEAKKRGVSIAVRYSQAAGFLKWNISVNVSPYIIIRPLFLQQPNHPSS